MSAFNFITTFSAVIFLKYHKIRTSLTRQSKEDITFSYSGIVETASTKKSVFTCVYRSTYFNSEQKHLLISSRFPKIRLTSFWGVSLKCWLTSFTTENWPCIIKYCVQTSKWHYTTILLRKLNSTELGQEPIIIQFHVYPEFKHQHYNTSH